MAEGGDGPQKLRSGDVDPPLALDRLQQNCGGIRARGVFQGSRIIERQIPEARQQGIKAFLNLGLARSGHRTEGAAVERLLKSEHLEARRAVGLRAAVAKAAGGLDEAVVRLGTGVAEEDFAGKPDVLLIDFAGEGGLLRNLIEVGHMNQDASLLAKRRHQTRMAMA